MSNLNIFHQFIGKKKYNSDAKSLGQFWGILNWNHCINYVFVSTFCLSRHLNEGGSGGSVYDVTAKCELCQSSGLLPRGGAD